jgi:phenylacetate-CoA ligase
VAAGEVFDEAWRARVCEQLGAEDPALTIASLYGTADGGVLANETPTSVRIRRTLAERPELLVELFGQARLPTLCQFAPNHRFIEKVEERVVFSADGVLPLLRYDILDQGGVIGAEEMAAFLQTHGLQTQGLTGEGAQLDAEAEPFVYVFGRSGSAISYYGANVYAENIGPGLHRPELSREITGKFVLEVLDHGAGARLQVTVELARDALPSNRLTEDVRASIEEQLIRQNSEYANYVPAERRTPDVVLKPFGDAQDFPAGTKHRFTRH